MAAKNKILQAVVEIAGNVSPTLASSIQDTIGKLDKLNVKALAVGAGVAGGVAVACKAIYSAGKYLVNLGTRFDDVEDTIRIGTGATGDALDALMNDFSAVYSAIPTAMEDAAAVIADYNTLLGLTGEELQDLSIQAIQVASMLDEDVGDVVAESSKAFQQWSIDAKDMGGAMDFVFKASQSTGVGFSELMSDLQMYGAQFQTMGYSFEEATAMIGQLEKAGVNTNEVLAAMKKSVATLAQHGIGAAEGLDLYVEAITNAKDMTTATALAAEAFGTRAASTMAAAIRDGTFDVAALTAALQENQETINACAADTYDFAEQLQIFKQQAEVALKPIAATLFNALNELMPVVGKLMESLIPIIDDLVKVLVPLIDNIVTEIAPLLTELLTPVVKIADSLLTKIIPPLVRIITDILPVVIQLVDAVAIIVEPVFEMLGAVLPLIAELLSAVMKVVSKLLSKILPFVEKVLAAVMPIITSIVEAVLPLLISLLDTLMPILDIVFSLLDPILDVVLAILTPLLQLINTILKPIISLIQTLITKALEPLKPIIEAVAGLFSGVLGGALEYLRPLIEMFTNILGGLMEFVQNVFAGNWSAAWGNIKDVFANVWEGIKELGKGAINGLITVVETGINFLIKMINGLTQGLSKAWTWLGIPAIPEIPLLSLPRLATGGFTDGVSIAGEEGTEAVISFDPAYRKRNIETWEAAGKLLGVVGTLDVSESAKAATAASVELLAAENARAESPQLAQAGQLIEMDGFSLGELTETTIIYYDFSGFTWAPTVNGVKSEKKENVLEALKENESEFFDWLENWIRTKEVGRYDRVTVY